MSNRTLVQNWVALRYYLNFTCEILILVDQLRLYLPPPIRIRWPYQLSEMGYFEIIFIKFVFARTQKHALQH